MIRQNNLPEMLAVRRGKPVLPIIRSQAELSAAGHRFEAARLLRMKAHTPAPQCHWRPVWFFQRPNRSAIAPRATVNPVIDPPLQAIDQLLNIGQGEASVKSALPVGCTGVFRVLEKKDFGSIRYQQAAPVRHHRGWKPQIIRIDRTVFEKTITVAILEQFNFSRSARSGR